jgi:cell wall assembly regulator SMI1
MLPTMSPTLSALTTWLGQHLPATLADLAEPASDEAIAALEAHCGLALPETAKAIWRWHNGQHGAASGLFYGLQFLSLAAIAEEWNITRDLLHDDPTLASGEASSSPVGHVKAVTISLAWLPLASDGGGNFLGLNLDPGALGQVGQVISFGADEHHQRVLAPSLNDWLAWLLNQLEAGNFQFTDGGFNTKNPDNRHFFDGLAVLFP